MRIITIALIIFISQISCSNEAKITIVMENSSDIRDTILVETYVGSKFVDERKVSKHSISDSFDPFDILYPSNEKSTIITFKVKGTSIETSCVVEKHNISEGRIVHVNFIEILFKKGDTFQNGILTTDSIMKLQIYCELIKRKLIL